MSNQIDLIDIDSLRPHFRSIFLTRVDEATNARRWYFIGWQGPILRIGTLFGKAVVRAYGRLGSDRRRVLAPVVFDSLDDAWPLIRKTLRLRLRHGYVIVDEVDAEPVIRMTFNGKTARPVTLLEQLSLHDAFQEVD